MKKLFLVFGLIFLGNFSAHAAIAHVGSCSGTTSCTPSSAAVWAVEYAFAYRSGSTTAASVPTGGCGSTATCWSTVFTEATSSGGTTGVLVVACRVDTSATAAASGTFTNATNLGIVSYSGTAARSTADCGLNLVPIGGSALAFAKTSTSASFSALAMSVTNGTSWVISAMGNSIAANTCTPSGMAEVTGATAGDVAVSDTNGDVSSWSTTACTVTSSTWVSATFEIVVHQAAASIPSQVFEYYNSLSNLTDPEEAGNYFSFNAANRSPAGNLIAFAVSWTLPSGCTAAASCKPALSDNGSNIYTDAEDCTNAAQEEGTSVFYASNVAAGTQSFLFYFSGYGAVIENFNFRYINLAGIAAASPADGANCSTNTYPSANSYDNVLPGSITTTASGDLVWATINTQNNPGNPGMQDILPHSGAALLAASMYDYTVAQELEVQTSAGAINPGFGMMQFPANDYEYYGATVIAFKTSPGLGGGYSGIHILGTQQVSSSSTTAQPMLLPSSGNLLVMVSDAGGTDVSVTGTIPASPPWTTISNAATYNPATLYSANATGTDTSTMLLFDFNGPTQPENIYLQNIVGAAASPIDNSVTCGGSSVSAGTGTGSCVNSNNNGIASIGQTTSATITSSQTSIPFTANTTCTNGTYAMLDTGANVETIYIDSGCGTSTLTVTRPNGTATYYYSTSLAHSGNVWASPVFFTDGPTIKPSVSNGLILGVMNTGIGPPASAANCTFNQSWYLGSTDQSYLGYGDGHCNLYPTSTAAIAIGWNMQNGGASGTTGTTWDALATSLLPASGSVVRHRAWVIGR